MTPAARTPLTRLGGPAAEAHGAAGAVAHASAVDWSRQLDQSPRSALQRQRLAAAFGWPETQREGVALERPAAHPGSEAAVAQRSAGGRMLKTQIYGMNKTVNPFFGWKGYYKGMKDIIAGKDAAEKYGSAPWRVLNAAVVTADRVASLATALAFVLTGVGTIMTAFYGTGAAVLAVATILGIIATIAHAVTFLLRSVVTIYDAVRLARVGDDAHQRALLKAKMWNNVGGLISNGLGVLFGGLTGGFLVAGPLTTALGGAIGGAGTATGDAAASGASVLVAEGANRVADLASGTGAIKAHGIEKRDERAQHSPSLPLPERDEPERAPVRGHRSDSDSDSEPGPDANTVSPTVVADLQEIEPALKELSEEERRGTDQQDHVDHGITSALPKLGEMLDDTKKVETQSEAAEKQLGGAENIVASAEPRKSRADKVGELEQQMTSVEQAQGGSGESATVAASSTAEQGEKTGASEKKGVTNLKGRAAAAAASQPPVQFGVGAKLKRLFGALGGRMAGLRKRIKGAMAKAKLKLTQFTIKALGLRKPLLEVQAQQPQDRADVRAASAITGQTAASADELGRQIAQARQQVEEAQR